MNILHDYNKTFFGKIRLSSYNFCYMVFTALHLVWYNVECMGHTVNIKLTTVIMQDKNWFTDKATSAWVIVSKLV